MFPRQNVLQSACIQYENLHHDCNGIRKRKSNGKEYSPNTAVYMEEGIIYTDSELVVYVARGKRYFYFLQNI